MPSVIAALILTFLAFAMLVTSKTTIGPLLVMGMIFPIISRIIHKVLA